MDKHKEETVEEVVEEARVSTTEEVTEGDGRSSDDPRNDPGPPRPEDAL